MASSPRSSTTQTALFAIALAGAIVGVFLILAYLGVNLLDEAWPIRTRFDLIFCRNVLMYFDRPTQAHLVARLERMLTPDGLLLLGHAENLLGLTTDMRRVTSTIYRHAEATAA